MFFTISLVMVIVWVPTLALFPSVDTWQLVDEADPERLRRHAGELRAAIGFEREI